VIDLPNIYVCIKLLRSKTLPNGTLMVTAFKKQNNIYHKEQKTKQKKNKLLILNNNYMSP